MWRFWSSWKEKVGSREVLENGPLVVWLSEIYSPEILVLFLVPSGFRSGLQFLITIKMTIAMTVLFYYVMVI